MSARHTSCRFCGQDIEGLSPYRKGEWRDRGNNTHCPTGAGDRGQIHEPYTESTAGVHSLACARRIHSANECDCGIGDREAA